MKTPVRILMLAALLAAVSLIPQRAPVFAQDNSGEQEFLPFDRHNYYPLPGMELIPPGTYEGGPPSDPRTITIEPFYLDTHEVTQREYEEVTGHNPSFFKDPERPVEKVDWFDARDYCKKVNRRLPTEWEWEWAARGGTDGDFYWGEGDADAHAWHAGNADKQTHPVGQKQPNAYGLYDMAGNVWEWTVSDHENGGKVQRGGSWRNGVESLKTTYRILSLPHFQYHYAGFRCALDAGNIPESEKK